MKKKKPVREFYVLIQPFERYDTIYFCNRDVLTKSGRVTKPYFLEGPKGKAEHSFVEAQETVNFLKSAYPGRPYKTVSKVQVSNRPIAELIKEDE